MQIVHDSKGFNTWLAHAQPGDKCQYAALAYPELKSKQQQALFDRAHSAWRKGLVFLGTKPIEPLYLWPGEEPPPRTRAWIAVKASSAAMAAVHVFSNKLAGEPYGLASVNEGKSDAD